MPPLMLAQRSNPTRTGHEGVARLENMIVEDNGEDAKQQFSLHAASGLEEWASPSGAVEIRAMITADPYLYVVAGRVLYRIEASGTAVELGGIPTDGLVTMAVNRRSPVADIGIVSDGLYYVVRSGVLQQVNDVDLPPACSIAVLDGQFILPGYDNRWFISGVDDGLTIDALDFASAESSPDANVRAAVVGQEAVLLGAQSAEWWQSATSDFPFARVTARNVGCYAAGSVANVLLMREGQAVGDVLIWAGTDQRGSYAGVYMAQGYQPVKISPAGLDRAIEAETDHDSIRSFAWVEGGKSYYAIVGSTFSWQFDTTGRWYQRSSYNLPRWRVQTVAAFAGMLVAGDYDNGKIYRMHRDIQDEDGSHLVCTVVLPPVHAFPHGIVFDRLDIDVTPGVGLVHDFGNDDYLTADDGSTDLEVDGTATDLTPDIREAPDTYANNMADVEPLVMIDWSDDGGQSWRGQRSVTLGRAGETSARVSTTRLGSCSQGGRSFRLSCSANVVRAIHAVHAETRARR